MTTVINSPGSGEGSGTGIIIGVIVAIVLIALFIFYGLPAMRGGSQAPQGGGASIDIDLPTGGNGGGGTGGTGGGTGGGAQ